MVNWYLPSENWFAKSKPMSINSFCQIFVFNFNGTHASTGKLMDVKTSLGWTAPVEGSSPANVEWTDCTTCATWSTAAVAAKQTILTKRVHMNPISQIRVHRRVVKTPMTPTKYIRSGFQDATEILIKNRYSAVDKRHFNMRYHLAHTDDPNRKRVKE